MFANFRNVAVGDLGENAFFRSSSPVNNELGRASYADDLAEAGGIQAVMNLADSNELIEGYIAAEGFDSPYYQSLYEACLLYTSPPARRSRYSRGVSWL